MPTTRMATWRRDPALNAIIDAQILANTPYAQVRDYLLAHGHHTHVVSLRTYGAALKQQQRRLQPDTIAPPPPADAPPAPFTSDKKESSFNWRNANPLLRSMQDMKARASGSQEYASIDFSQVTEPICVLALSDAHFGSIGCDYETLERVTDEILTIPNLYVAVLGDMLEMAIKLRSVLEVHGNVLSPPLQLAYLESWLAEIAHKVLFACWDNHSSERLEKQSGIDSYGELFKKRTIFHSGIGHPDVIVGSQTYRFAVSHVFRGRSMYNVTHGQARYLRMEAPDREICMAGDSHVPGLAQYVEGGTVRTVINGGTGQVNSGYARRYFSLKSWATWPCVMLDPTEHRVTPFWSVSHWLAAAGRMVPAR